MPAAPCGASGFSGAAGVVSDYVVYGNSLSGGRASAVGDVAYRADNGWSLAAGAATLGSSNPRGRLRLNLGAGLDGVWLEQLAWQATASRIQTLGSGANRRPGYSELSAGVGFEGRWQLSATLSPDFPNGRAGVEPRRGSAVHIEVTAHQPLRGGLAFDAGLGRASYGRIGQPGYGYGSVGMSFSRWPLQFSASRIFSSSESPTAAGPRAVLSLLCSF